MTLLIDIGELDESQTDRALNTIYKAIQHSHDDDESIWAAHESPYIRRLIELFTQRGLMRLDGFRDELMQWIDGEKHQAGPALARPVEAMRRWSKTELGLVKLYLERLPPAQFTLDDWMMVVDYLAQRYLPDEDMRTEAEWMAVRSTFMGRVQANMENMNERQADVILAALPSTVEGAAAEFSLTPLQRIVLDYARVRGVENVQKLADKTRHRMRDVIADHTEQTYLGVAGTRHALQTTLLDEFGTLNRDWRRIAITEAGENANQGYVSSMKPGERLQRVEQYRGACSWCKSIDGRIVTVVAPDKKEKDGNTEVWPGKTNVGRSAAPRKRVGNILVHREPDEMYWIAAGTQHPHCRGRWVPVADRNEGDDPDFADWMDKELAEFDKQHADDE